MAVIVLDGSVAVSWLFDDEVSAETENLLDRVTADGAIVPNLWHLEISNAIIKAERRGRISTEKVPMYFNRLEILSITVDPETAAQVFSQTASLARTHGLSSYDASYLELAARSGLPLATLDKKLRAAAGAEKVEVLPV